jgi:hypothetical protein
MAPFEVLCGRRCHTPLNWIESEEKVKDRRRRPEGGGEWESIKISHGIWPMSQNQSETPLF